ncbi:hypothetical protein AALA52_03530 [Lactococcus ileimucosae]|uniref:Uncharacterized protein n=1 Tax=Lactococcus ileimucosae TaxID=2941329 RepID=A0ABV4D183_9LACT
MADLNSVGEKKLSETALKVFRLQKKKNFWLTVLVIEVIFIIIALWGLIKNIITNKINGPFTGTIILWIIILCISYLTYFMYKKNYNAYNLEVTPQIKDEIFRYLSKKVEKNKRKTYTNRQIMEERNAKIKIPQEHLSVPDYNIIDTLNVGIFPSLKILKMSNGLYSIGEEHNLSFQKYIWNGKRVKTISKTNTKGRKGKTLTGAIVGSTINPAGAIVGGLVGASGKRKSTTEEIEYEKSSKITFIFKTKMGDTKSYSCNIKSDKIHDIEVFFS